MNPRAVAATLLLALTGLAGLARAAAPACEKKLRWNDDPPFSMRLPDGAIGGVQIDINVEALRRMGCGVKLVEMPFARALVELEHGDLDVLAGAFRRPEREAYAWFSTPALHSRNMLYIRRADAARWPFKSLLELRGSPFRLGAQIGVVYGPDYAALMRDEVFARGVSKVSNRHGLWQMLERGRIDGVIADELTAEFELAGLKLSDKLLKTLVMVSDEPAPTAFSMRSTDPGFVERYNSTIEAMRRDGSLQRIVQRYLGAEAAAAALP
ncbi:transporter substrate-binding domain-containing protein [Paucibacter sediminis]|uniref:Transporter substrate-binding domain-containing protein n=1 Tax=Paucibacter sediminis TaxID=3019553 RepID=A0AA95SMD6_9BURK|nr:transporter substrate-binding domain-containing protein [Paucibacter sp. S2-9]WIT10040.1 transporter substrate-binding domain-containing protein [Paucibacter sp. S2-9]